jgi:hypothetical protein
MQPNSNEKPILGNHDQRAPCIVICTSGHLGSGKNTASNLLKRILVNRLNRTMPHVHVVDDAFAARLKHMFAAAADIPLDLTMTQSGKNVTVPIFGATVGESLQDQGELFRWFYGEDIWSTLLFQKERNIPKSHICILNITDGRYCNEIDDVLKNRYGYAIRIEGDPCGVRQASTRNLSHASETSLDNYKKFSVRIDNSRPDIDFLESQLMQFVDDVIMPSLWFPTEQD